MGVNTQNTDKYIMKHIDWLKAENKQMLKINTIKMRQNSK